MPCDVLRLSPCTEQPHPLVGHVTGGMKRRESNETRSQCVTRGKFCYFKSKYVRPLRYPVIACKNGEPPVGRGDFGLHLATGGQISLSDRGH